MIDALKACKDAIRLTGSGLRPCLDRVEGLLAGVEKRIAAVSSLVIVAAIAMTILVRVAGLPLPSFGEYALVAMSPLTFVGAAFCSYMHRHITIDIVSQFGNGTFQRLARIAASVAMAAFAAIFTWISWKLFLHAFSSGESLIDLGTPVWIPVGFIVLGSVLMFLHATLDVLRLCLGAPQTGAVE